MNRRKLPLLSTLAVLGLFLALPVARAGEKAYDEPPVPMKTVPPVHPVEMKRNGIGGMVSVMITVDEKGAVQNPVVQKSSDSAFERPAIEAVNQWKFKPAKKDGQPVAVKVVVPVKFTID